MLPALRKAADSLAKADLPAARDLRDKAEAIRAYLRRAGESLAVQNQCCAIKLRAERRIGELLAGMVHRGRPKRLHDETILADLGITKTQSHRFQLIARLPLKLFESHLDSARELTTASVLKLAKEHVRLSRRATGPAVGGNIFTCDIAELPVEDIDLILTDPPYTDINTYGRLVEFAADKLKPGALCLAYCGHHQLPEVLATMSARLDYFWTFAAVRGGTKRAAQFGKRLIPKWKPVVAFSRGPAATHEWLSDALTGGQRDKELHDWQKPDNEAEYLIERLTERGGLVVDPFCGSGTVLAAARRLGRRWIGCDIDAAAAGTARRRVATKTA